LLRDAIVFTMKTECEIDLAG